MLRRLNDKFQVENFTYTYCQGDISVLILGTLLYESAEPHTGGGSRAAATSKMECFVIIVNGWKPLTIITKHSILDAAAALDPPLILDPLKRQILTFIRE